VKLLESEAIFFDGPEAFYQWLEAHHDSESEVLVGMYKKHTGKQTMTWSQAVDQALCFGWIDGVMRRLDDERHVQRFTPRRPGSNWSKVNVEKMERLEAEGLVAEAGRRAFGARTDDRTGVYSFEEGQDARLSADHDERLRANAAAAGYWDSRPPWYRRTASHWVQSAKREETRERRLTQLIEDCAAGIDIKPLRRP
jgi:uncharacterized protein YdeI (YjbR/CyaY-like superfamily)